MPPGDSAKAAQLKPGEPASRILVLSTTARVDREFKRRGYLDARVSVAENKDPAAHTIGYAYAAEPGSLYHFKGVTTSSFSPQQQKDFDRAWKLQPGAAYDRDYIGGFFARNNLASLQGYKVKTAEQTDPSEHLVQVTYTLTR